LILANNKNIWIYNTVKDIKGKGKQKIDYSKNTKEVFDVGV